MLDTLENVGKFLSYLSPFIIAGLSAYVAKVDARNKKIQKMQEENSALIEERRKEEEGHIKDRIKKVEETADELKTTCSTIKNDLCNMEDINRSLSEKLDKIITLNEITMEYTHSISSVMTAIGGGLSDNPAISEAIEKHRKDESEIISKIMKTSY